MRTKCSRTDRTPVQLVGPRIEGADDAVAALRLSAGAGEPDSIVVLVCDPDRRIRLALDFASASVLDAPQALDIVSSAITNPETTSLVVGLFRCGSSTFLDGHELAAVEDVESICLAAGITVLDVIVISGHRWRSLAEAWRPTGPA